MFDAFLYSISSVILVSVLSIVGILTLVIRDKTLDRILLYFVSFSAGALLGDAFIHLLPESAIGGFTIWVSTMVLFGITFFFLMEKIIQWRHCHIRTSEVHPHNFAYMNLFGDSIHNFTDGLIIGASYMVGLHVGIATTLAIVFHEIPQEIGDFGVLLHGGFTKKKALLLNFATALTAVLGTISAFVLAGRVEGIVTYLLPFAAGGFIYIASTDLIPELHRENVCEGFSISAFKQLFFFISGVVVMYCLLFLG